MHKPKTLFSRIRNARVWRNALLLFALLLAPGSIFLAAGPASATTTQPQVSLKFLGETSGVHGKAFHPIKPQLICESGGTCGTVEYFEYEYSIKNSTTSQSGTLTITAIVNGTTKTTVECLAGVIVSGALVALSTYISAGTLTTFTIEGADWAFYCAGGVLGSWLTGWFLN